VSEAEYYIDNRAGIIQYYITGQRAREIHEERKGTKHFVGNIDEGFSYWIGGPGFEQLVFVAVTPINADEVPQTAKDELAAGAAQVAHTPREPDDG
jgi:hypothetical protein